MKKLLIVTLALLAAAALLAACGKSESSSKAETASGTDTSNPADTTAASEDTSSEPEAPAEEGLKAPVADAPFDPASGITENMLTRSVHFEGDTSRLAAKLRNICDEGYSKGSTVVFLGDSITQGSGASGSKNQYTALIEEWFDENAKSSCVCINAGIGATDSYLGVHRADRDVLANDPDIVFIEFINDADNEFYKSTMDSLIRKCLSCESQPAVVLIEMSLKGGGNCQSAHSAAAEAYNVPVLSYHDAVAPEVEAGNFSFDDISGDGTHPNDIGHGWVADIAKSFLEKVKAGMDSAPAPEAFDPSTPSPTGDKFADATILDSASESLTVSADETFAVGTTPSQFKNGWKTSEGGTITFEAEFRNLGLLYYKSTSGKYGSVSVDIDGEKKTLVNADFKGGWGSYPTNAECYSSDETKKHTVTITVRDGEKQKFEVLGLLVS